MKNRQELIPLLQDVLQNDIKHNKKKINKIKANLAAYQVTGGQVITLINHAATQLDSIDTSLFCLFAEQVLLMADDVDAPITSFFTERELKEAKTAFAIPTGSEGSESTLAIDSSTQKQTLFQPQIKQEFLQTLTEETQKPYLRVLQIAADTEYLHSTDLYDMNIDQIADVIKSINPLTLASARGVIGYIKRYIEWAMTEKGLSKVNIHPLAMIDPSWYEQFVDFTKKLYFSNEEIYALEEDLLNAQDAVILRLLFEGVYGDGQNELLNLKMRDLSQADNRLRLYDDIKGERMIEVSDRCVQLIREAYKQTKYFNRNGTVENSRRSTSLLVDAGYIVKTAKTRGKNVSRAAKHVIYRRLSVIGEIFEIPYLTTKNVWKSGQIKMAYDLYMRDGELGSRQFYEIADRFRLTKMKNQWGDGEHYNVSLMKDYITSRNLKELYHVDVEI